MSPRQPSEQVLAAFGAQPQLTRLHGGSCVCYSDGKIVLKPSEDEEESQWIGNTLVSLFALEPSLTYRVPRPIASIQNSTQYVVDGWTAMSMLPGRNELPIRFADTFRVSQAFHEALRKLNLEKPRLLGGRINRWSEADRVVWGEKQLSEVANVNKEVLAVSDDALKEYEKLTRPLPTDVTPQLIHGDLTGNILFDDEAGEPPGIIDMTFYWRPAAYAEAIVVADGLAWYKQGRGLIESYGMGETRLQLLVRALHWRCLTFCIDPIVDWVRANIPKVDFIGAACLLGEVVDGASR